MVYIHQNVFDEIRSALGTRKPECGGVLGACSDGRISKFYFDTSGISSEDAYTPDYEKINGILEEWAEEGVRMVGMIHSHGNEGNFPSCGDLFYCEQILRSNPSISDFLLPIVTVNPFEIHMYRVRLETKLRVLSEPYQIV
ncbi:MAG: Mov34/MPN/PAD-1 family protein [Clostridia bacterium]|nr:Mov34/MPN/PAD-1 family protein [Clostridia bacterium]